jgi:alkaline phosphatase D
VVSRLTPARSISVTRLRSKHQQDPKRGYVVLTLTPREARNEYLEISTVLSLDYSAKVATTLRVLPSAGNLEVLAS